MKRTCPICGQEDIDPDSQEHLMSKIHQSALEASPALRRHKAAMRKLLRDKADRASRVKDSIVSEQHFVIKAVKEKELPLPVSRTVQTIDIDRKLEPIKDGINSLSDALKEISSNIALLDNKISSIESTMEKLAITVETKHGVEKTAELSARLTDHKVSRVMDEHTLGIMISFFDQIHGPVPIVVIPEVLKEHHGELVDIADKSFSNCQVDGSDFTSESKAIFSYNFAHTIALSCLCYGFALERPDKRGGYESITVSILILKNCYETLRPFTNHIDEKIHLIHELMDKRPDEKSRLIESINELRDFISRLIIQVSSL
ncbi:MAG: hypothetical protein ACTSP4_02935 [Candidatus Hodarchaeales archaeon]